MICTGNEYVSLPEIREDGSLDSFNVLYMGCKGIIEFRGDEKPLLKPSVFIDGKKAELSDFSLLSYFIPSWKGQFDGISFSLTLFAPVKNKGFVYYFEFENRDIEEKKIEVSLELNWKHTLHTVNVSKEFEGSKNRYLSSWSNLPCFDIRNGFPVLAYAFDVSRPTSWDEEKTSAVFILQGKEKGEYSLFIGVGYEEVSAVTSGWEMRRRKSSNLLNKTLSYLDSVIVKNKDKTFESCLNRNLLFSLFYAVGRTIDTEQLVTVTSRSPRYYVSAAYWDRDSLLWSFPAICHADKTVAREILDYVATIQCRNIGIHSRYIDGTVLEDGFELDELCAPVIALEYYIKVTKDVEVLKDVAIQSMIQSILLKLDGVKNPNLGLYETFLQPTDDMHFYPYLTYDNSLVFRVYEILESWNFDNNASLFSEKKEAVKSAIDKHCIRDDNGVKQYIWSLDENGQYDIYDEPPGSLLLLPLFNICRKDDEFYQNTVRRITDPTYEYSFANMPYGAIGCPHAPHPWVLSLANLIRVNHDKDALLKLLSAPMDYGIACESIDENTGYSSTGEAFATCAGYVAFTLIEEGKKVKKVLIYEPMGVRVEHCDASSAEYLQSIFFQGNGELGFRALLPGDKYCKYNHGVFRAGFFEYIERNITDMVNLPDPILYKIKVGDDYLPPLKEFSQCLDFSTGVVKRTFSYAEVTFCVERVVSFAQVDKVAMRLVITNPKHKNIVVEDIVDTDIMNLPVNDDQTSINTKLIKLMKDGTFTFNGKQLVYKAGSILDTFSVSYSKISNSDGEINRVNDKVVHLNPTVVESVVSLDGKELNDDSFDSLLSSNKKYLETFWNSFDIELDGDIKAQSAIRYNIFMMLSNAPRKEVSIGARGLTHGRYKGCYFWDTEIFMLPYFLYSSPQSALNILRYRLLMLDKAIENSRKHNTEGARFPWMCSLDGSEQCDTWDIGKSEIHITADVVWAFNKYIEMYGFKGLDEEKVKNLYYQTALFWCSRFTFYKESNTYHLLSVKGPDEYAGVTLDNTFTIEMARFNVSLALKYCTSLSLKDKEKFENFVNNVKSPYSKEIGTYLEDALFNYKEEVDLSSLKKSLVPLYHSVCFDKLQRLRVIKQPDVVLLYLLLPKLFTREEAYNAFDYYEKYTAHDSTLSFGMHALAAFKLGIKDKALYYLDNALYLDLEDRMENTGSEGLHIGAMGAVLEALLFGLREAPSSFLPEGWNSIKFKNL